MNLNNSDFLSLYLQLVTSKLGGIRAKVKFAILDTNRQHIHVKTTGIVHRYDLGNPCGFDAFIRRKQLVNKDNNLLPGDQLMIYCEVDAVVDRPNSHGQKSNMSLDVPEGLLAPDMSRLLESQKFSDVVLAVGGREFYSHKALLAARSRVFAAIFEHDTKENETNRVEIVDVEPDVFEEVLTFIYTGRAPNLDKVAEDLLIISDKYFLEGLKRMCEEWLSSKLSTDTAAASLVFSDVHNAGWLKRRVIDFIAANLWTVMETDGWKTVSQHNPHLIIEALQDVAREQSLFNGPQAK